LFFEIPQRRPSAGNCGRRKRCRKPGEEGSSETGVPRPWRIETLRGCFVYFVSVLVRGGGVGEAKVRERRQRGAGADVEARKPQEAETQERIGQSLTTFTGSGDGSRIRPGAKAWEPRRVGGVRWMVRAVARCARNGRQGRVRREASLPGPKRKPLKGESRGCQPGETDGQGAMGSKASGGRESP